MVRIAAIAAAAAVLVTAACGVDDEGAPTVGETRTATLSVLPGWDEVHPHASGTAELTAGDGTDVTLTVAELQPNTNYTAHIHDAACDTTPPGGDHWMADPDQGESPDNEIHLAFRTSGDGIGNAVADSDLTADDRAVSIVVHTSSSDALMEHMPSDRILCGEFR